MCFALPLRVSSVSKKQAVMEDNRRVDYSLVGSIKKGNWLMVQSNLAVAKLASSEAKSIRAILKEVSSGFKD